MKKKMVLVHPCPKCGSTYLAHGKPYGCATPWLVAWLGSDAYGNYHTNTEYIDNPEIPFCITYNNGRFWPPIAWSKFDRLKWSGD